MQELAAHKDWSQPLWNCEQPQVLIPTDPDSDIIREEGEESRTECDETEGDSSGLLRYFPGRAINASSLVEMTGGGVDKFRVRANNKKKAAQDVDIELQDLLSQLEEQNIEIPITKLADFSYELVMPEGKKNVRLLFKLSGTLLMVRSGGGYCSFLEFLERKGFLN